MRAQAFLLDALLALALALLAGQALFVRSFAYTDTSASLRADRAGYDLVNYIYMDESFHRNITHSLERNGRIAGPSLMLLRQRLGYYGALLGLSAIDFEVEGVQAEHIEVSGDAAAASERRCFPLVVGNGTRVLTGCITVWA